MPRTVSFVRYSWSEARPGRGDARPSRGQRAPPNETAAHPDDRLDYKPRVASQYQGKVERVSTTGKVKWFNTVKGFGFITRDDDGSDVFVHVGSAVLSNFPTCLSQLDFVTTDAFNTLVATQRVRFEVDSSNAKGPVAKRVQPISDE